VHATDGVSPTFTGRFWSFHGVPLPPFEFRCTSPLTTAP
jgi:hypothetical protein